MTFFNANGHDCNAADFDLDSYLSLEAADEERTVRGWVGVEDISYYPFDEEDDDFEETFWSSLLLGADYDWDDDLSSPEKIEAWVQTRYTDVIQLNADIGYIKKPIEATSFTPSFIGRSRLNVQRRHWSDRKTLRQNNPNQDKLRGKAHAK